MECTECDCVLSIHHCSRKLHLVKNEQQKWIVKFVQFLTCKKRLPEVKVSVVLDFNSQTQKTVCCRNAQTKEGCRKRKSLKVFVFIKYSNVYLIPVEFIRREDEECEMQLNLVVFSKNSD